MDEFTLSAFHSSITLAHFSRKPQLTFPRPSCRVEHTAEGHRWKAVLERALRAWAYNRAHAALQGWREGVREQKRLRETVTRAGLRWRNMQLVSIFSGCNSVPEERNGC